MVPHKARRMAALVLGAVLAVPAVVQAFPGGLPAPVGGGLPGRGFPGGMGRGGFQPGTGPYPGGNGWAWGNRWSYNLSLSPNNWNGGSEAAYQQAYYDALRQVQLEMALQQQADLADRRAAAQAAARAPRLAAGPALRPEPVAEVTPEERAAAKLKLAMRLAEYGQIADAAEFCAAIVKQYPCTPAAEKAQSFLDQVHAAVHRL